MPRTRRKPSRSTAPSAPLLSPQHPLRQFVEVALEAFNHELCPATASDGRPTKVRPGCRLQNWAEVDIAHQAAVAWAGQQPPTVADRYLRRVKRLHKAVQAYCETPGLDGPRTPQVLVAVGEFREAYDDLFRLSLPPILRQIERYASDPSLRSLPGNEGAQEAALGNAIQACILQCRENPTTVLFEKEPNYDRGLNADYINALVRALDAWQPSSGFPVFEVDPPCADNCDERFVRIYRPDTRDNPVEWCIWSRYGGHERINKTKLKRTINYLELWRLPHQANCIIDLIWWLRYTSRLTVKGGYFEALDSLLARADGIGGQQREAFRYLLATAVQKSGLNRQKVGRMPLPEFVELLIYVETKGSRDPKQCANKGTRGRTPKPETKQRADFARVLVEEGLGWSEIRQKYIEAYPADQAASDDNVRLAYQRTYAPKAK